MNLLLVDAGNTRIKWAIALPGAALGEWETSHAAPHLDLTDIAAAWRRAGISRAIVSNVAGLEVRERIAQALPAAIAVEWFASTLDRAGLRNGYRKPGQLGCDRFAAAIGARALAPGQNIVVATCGTATTVDAVRADGLFVGGMILPGLALMAASLARNTAQLPQVAPGAAAPPLFGDNTDDAIVSGILSAQAGAIERACAGHGASACIVSGGAATYIAPALKVGYRLVDNIVLVGLHAAAAD
ncbi:type III pantothenate kinase [Telluria aromaticivorans]|uniref:Type III pantothenate kinase n=1 Tax=Telluria aromaticivorans TaxID=2725995 RepID=A0A7Y2P075_9BURK|nr:type III pantothenate kinase [Telluria aromaticivorans]NNG24657.1 type III pantothenate kinase [Telluria aromaticivorans]